MKITVIAKTKSRKEGVEMAENGEYIVRVNEPPHEGRANQAIIKALSAYFGVSGANITLMSGATSKIKIFDIDMI